MSEMGLGYEDINSVNNRIIYGSISGFGTDGPYKDRAGYDVIAASVGGLMGVTGERGQGPVKVGVAVTDLATSLYAHGAILAALLQREKTGRGQKIELNLLSTQVSLMVNLASSYLNSGSISGRWGTQHASIVPYQTFATRDGYVTVGCGNDKQFAELCQLVGRPHWASDRRYASNESRVANREELVSELSAIMAEHGNKYWEQCFSEGSFPFGPVNNMQQVFEDPQVVHSGLRQQITHSTVGTVEQVGPAVRYSDSDNSIRSAPPTLGQHTDSVLSKLLGYDQEKILRLRQKNVIA